MTPAPTTRPIQRQAADEPNDAEPEYLGMVILTKTDIASAGDIANACEAIAYVRPDVTVIPSARADVSAAAVVAAIGEGPNVRRLSAGEAPAPAHSQNVTNAFVATPQVIEARALIAALIEITTRYDGALLRLKGIVRLAPDGALQGVQAMPGVGVEFTPVASRTSDEIVTGLTIIAQNTTARTIAKTLTAELEFHTRATRVTA